MAILLTNGKYYIMYNKNGRVIKTTDRNNAWDFITTGMAAYYKSKAPAKCAGFYYIDTETGEIQKDGKYLITNGESYICLNESGHHRKTTDKSSALRYDSIEDAMAYMRRAPKKTYKFSIVKEDETIVDWEDLNIKKKRKTFSQAVRKKVYDKSDGKCALCGRKLLFEDMTLDHIIPLAMGGKDAVENLQTAHLYCNHFKADILPDEFVERITEIFLYQIGKKYGSELKWEIVRMLIDRARGKK